ncbi:hypothetical protein T265_00493 [Opisthorchis viverrini]|uniref:Uncharacterized protein n=1 Tax=Opisthorchis viverrini TaxID=6198 RepID=A0A075A1J6_OPIVI|nr:hypothetical protein T265_00493 [Opisthorchis viverrini]KER33598.1 hypothetical protein T265_00493 [Opisthorchis viverrini]
MRLNLVGFIVDCYLQLSNTYSFASTRFAPSLADTTPAPYCGALWVQIPLRGSDSLLLGVVYRSPSSPPEDDQFLTQTLEQLSSSTVVTHLKLEFRILTSTLVRAQRPNKCIKNLAYARSNRYRCMLHRGNKSSRLVSLKESLGKMIIIIIISCKDRLSSLTPPLHPSAMHCGSKSRCAGERQPLTDKNKTDPGDLGKSLDPVYQSVNP